MLSQFPSWVGGVKSYKETLCPRISHWRDEGAGVVMHQLLSILVQRLLKGRIHYLVLLAGDGSKVDSDGQRKSSGKTTKK